MTCRPHESTLLSCFNLVIERLLISGAGPATTLAPAPMSSFNLVIERLLISGVLCFRQGGGDGFSFNLVIERLLISGPVMPPRETMHRGKFQSRYRAASHFRFRKTHEVLHICHRCFNLVIERLLISGAHIDMATQTIRYVSISLSSGFSFQEVHLRLRPMHRLLFQSRYRAASHFRKALHAECSWVAKFQSRYRAASHFRSTREVRFLLPAPVSISLSSGFSFQGLRGQIPQGTLKCFNLVIERLLISGCLFASGLHELYIMFQSRYRAASHFRDIR